MASTKLILAAALALLFFSHASALDTTGSLRTLLAGQCNAGYTWCGKKDGCIHNRSFATNPLHCGSCDNVCGTGATCTSGACVCPSGSPGDATTLASDVNNCGSCGNVCTAPLGRAPTCVKGNCGTRCLAGYTACGKDCINNRAFAVSPLHCGSCNNKCKSTQTCSAGQCV